jgi:copper resistance protein B
MKKIYLILSLVCLPGLAAAQGDIESMDDAVYLYLMVDEFEIEDAGGDNELSWDIDLSVGGDLHKFWTKTRGKRSDAGADQSELQLLYSKAILPFWDLQAGFRRDFDPSPDRDWAVLAIRGLAPSFFDVEAELFIAEGSQSGLRVKGEYELLINQRLVLAPELEIVSYSRNEPNRLIGSGLSEIEFALRLRYEVKREIAPYIGFSWQTLHGDTRDFARAAGRDGSDAVVSIGIRAWY